MKKINNLVLPNVPKEYYDRYVGKGMNGKCYITSNNDLYKEFIYRRDDYEIIKSLAETFNSPHLAFPHTFIFLEDDIGKLVGYLRNYIDGETLDNLSLSTKMDDFIQALCEFEKDLYQNTMFGLEYRDIHAGNMIYTPNNQIIAIDTEGYDISYEETKSRIIDSLYELYYTICGEMLKVGYIQDFYVKEIINRSARIGYSDFLRTSQMLEVLISYLENKNKCKIETYGDLKSKLVLMKRR